MWAIGLALFFGLPDYYRQKPGAIPSFYVAVCRKGVVLVSDIWLVSLVYANGLSGFGPW